MSCKLGITIIYVHDIQKMTEFYTQALGLAIIKEQTSDTFVTLAAGGTWIALADVAGPWVSRKLNLLPAKRETPIAPVSIELSFEVKMWTRPGKPGRRKAYRHSPLRKISHLAARLTPRIPKDIC